MGVRDTGDMLSSGEKLKTMTLSESENVSDSRPPGLANTVWGQQSLAQCAGLGVTLLEYRTLGSGMTGRTTAHIMTWNDDYYYVLQSEYGQEKTKLVAQAHRAAVDFIENTVQTENIDCDFSRLDGYLFPHNSSNSTFRTLDKELQASIDAGIHAYPVPYQQWPALEARIYMYLHVSVERARPQGKLECMNTSQFGGPHSHTLRSNEPLAPFHGFTGDHQAVSALRLTDTEMVDLKGDPAAGGIHHCLRYPQNGEFHPLKYIQGLADAITRRGGRICEMSRVTRVGEDEVETSDGIKVAAAKGIVMATCSPINHNLAVHARQEADRSYVVGIRIPEAPRAVSEDHGGPTFRAGKDTILIVGGEDHSTGQSPSKYDHPYQKLEAYARERWPACKDVVYRWSGQPADQLHLYGLNPLDPTTKKQYIATGDSGQGMTGGTIAGILIPALIAGENHPWKEGIAALHSQYGCTSKTVHVKVFSPSRMLRLKGLPGLAMEAAKTIEGYAKLILPMLPRDIEDMAPGEGFVGQKGLHKVAAYCDENSEKHVFSAVCPHLGCLINWNPIEKTFDCPCAPF
eukprot:jgi/Botrbrau1/5605/Bobra.97_2s0028.1